MAKKKHYKPGPAAQQVAFLNNYSSKLGSYIVTIPSVTAGDVTQAVADALFFNDMHNLLTGMRAFNKNLTDFKDLTAYGPVGPTPTAPPVTITLPTPVPAGIFARVSSVSERLKGHPNYIEAIGSDLGLIGEDHVVDVPNSKPVLTFFKEPHGWRIEFNLHQFFDGVSIYKKLPSAAGFTHLATDRHAPYVDNSPVENDTQYYAFYLLGDAEVGLQSDVVRVKVTD